MKNLYFAVLILASLFCGPVFSQDKSNIKALLITGGCCHEQNNRAAVLKAGISERCGIPIEWTVVEQTGGSDSTKIALFENENWAAGFDIVIHDHCIPKLEDEDWVDRILKPHREGLPAIIIHCALQSYPTKSGDWAKFCGAETKSANKTEALSIVFENSGHAIERPLKDWLTTSDESIAIKSILPSTRLLAKVEKRDEPAAWCHIYGENKSKVFAISFGNKTKTIGDDSYLNLVTSGLLWATSKGVRNRLLLRADKNQKVYSPLHFGSNLFSSSSETLSSSEDSLRAIDGNINTYWRPEKTDLIHWWSAGLKQPAEIQAIAIRWDSPTTHPYLLETSMDGKRWKLTATGAITDTKNPLNYHEFSETLRYIRISNPKTGTFSGIAEFAAYDSIENVPWHIKSVATKRIGKIRPPATPFHSGNKLEPIPIKQILALIDSSRDLAEKEKLITLLGSRAEKEVVKRLIVEIEGKTSRKIQQNSISALASVYRNTEQEVWDQSPEIARFLESLFQEKKVDKRRLVSLFIQNDIPVFDLSVVIKSTAGDPELKHLLLNLIEQNSVTYNSVGFLSSVVKDPSENTATRIKAASLLAQSADMFAMQQSFKMAVAEEFESEQLEQTVIANPTWESQQAWITQLATEGNESERALAWRILLTILHDPLAHKDSKDEINTLIVNTELADRQLLTLISIYQNLPSANQACLLPVLKRAKSSASEDIKTAVEEALKKNSPTDRDIDAPISQFVPGLASKLVRQIQSPDTSRGAELYSQHCSICHAKSAPTLNTSLATFRSQSSLLEAIINPNKTIASGYSAKVFKTKDGNQYQGFLGRRLINGIELVDQAGNELFIASDRIKSQKRLKQSAMPDKIAAQLSPVELADLIAYLQTLK